MSGIDIDRKEWIRLSPGIYGEPMSKGLLSYPDGKECEPLDIVSVDILRAAPYRHHTENLVIRPGAIAKLGRTSIEEVTENIYPCGDQQNIFFNTEYALTEGEMKEAKLDYSMLLVRVENLSIQCENSSSGRMKMLAEFQYNDREYKHIRITDPCYSFGGGAKHIPHAVIVMSIARDPFDLNGKYYKFAAKIFESK